MSPELLLKLWGINISDAKRTLPTKSHDHIRILDAIDFRVKTMAHQCAYKVLGEYLSTFASNTCMSNVIST